MERTKKSIGIIGLLVLVLVVAGCSANTPTSSQVSMPVNNEDLRIAEVSLPGMSCKFCAEGAKNLISGTEGVVDVNINFERKTGTIVYDSSKTSQEVLAKSDGINWYNGEILNDEKYNK